MKPFERGDFVTVTYCGQTIKAMVLLASSNGVSLMLGFDGALNTADGGMFVGALPVMRADDGVFYDLTDSASPVRLEYSSSPLTVEPAFACITCPRCGRTSYNPTDIEQGYCGACHDWTSKPGGKT